MTESCIYVYTLEKSNDKRTRKSYRAKNLFYFSHYPVALCIKVFFMSVFNETTSPPPLEQDYGVCVMEFGGVRGRKLTETGEAMMCGVESKFRMCWLCLLLGTEVRLSKLWMMGEVLQSWEGS
jgi:hypothetical protein